MADNVAITAGAGTSIATDDIGGVHYQIIKLAFGALDAQTIVSSSNGLPVAILAGSASIGILGANSGVDIGDVTINNASGGSAVNIQDGGNSITVDGLFAGATGSAVPANAVYMAGKDNDGNLKGLNATYQGRQVFEKSADGVTVSGNILLESRRQPINVNTNGQILISGMANRKIRVLNGVLMAATAVTVNIKSNNNYDCSGPLPLGATGGFQIPHADLGNFETLAGQNLTIALSSSVQVGGWLTYVIV